MPQSLSYLVDDVARRHGRLRGGAAASFLRCDDEALLAEVLANPVAAEHDLRLIAPTVVISPDPLHEVLAGLRAAGFAPAAEGPDGRVVDIRPGGRRLPAKARAPRRNPGEQAVLTRTRRPDRLQPARGRRGLGPPPRFDGPGPLRRRRGHVGDARAAVPRHAGTPRGLDRLRRLPRHRQPARGPPDPCRRRDPRG